MYDEKLEIEELKVQITLLEISLTMIEAAKPFFLELDSDLEKIEKKRIETIDQIKDLKNKIKSYVE